MKRSYAAALTSNAVSRFDGTSAQGYRRPASRWFSPLPYEACLLRVRVALTPLTPSVGGPGPACVKGQSRLPRPSGDPPQRRVRFFANVVASWFPQKTTRGFKPGYQISRVSRPAIAPKWQILLSGLRGARTRTSSGFARSMCRCGRYAGPDTRSTHVCAPASAGASG